MKPCGAMQLAIFAAVVYLTAASFDDFEEIPPFERLALRNYLLDNFLGNGPETRMEEMQPEAKPEIPPNTFVSGGTGEGKQHLGSMGNIPNKQIAIPEIPTEYETPPNPCPVGASLKGASKVASKGHDGMTCACSDGWDKEEAECTKAPKCCLMHMPNNANFVQMYQLESRSTAHKPRENKYHDGVKRSDHQAKKSPSYMSKRNANYNGAVYKRRINPYLKDTDRLDTVVAKKSPSYMNRLPAM